MSAVNSDVQPRVWQKRSATHFSPAMTSRKLLPKRSLPPCVASNNDRLRRRVDDQGGLGENIVRIVSPESEAIVTTEPSSPTK